MLLGLDGVVIKGHGGLSADGFSGAIEIGYGRVRRGLLEKIRDMMSFAEEHALAAEQISAAGAEAGAQTETDH